MLYMGLTMLIIALVIILVIVFFYKKKFYEEKILKLKDEYNYKKEQIHEDLLIEQKKKLKILNDQFLSEKKIAEEEIEKLIFEKEKITKETFIEYEDIMRKINESADIQKTINKEILLKQQSQNEIDFHRIILNKENNNDLLILKEIEPKIINKQIINKIIYENFYKQPLTDLLNRLVPTKICGIYKITNIKNKKIYIGKSTDIRRRWTEHIKTSLNLGTIAKTKIHSALKDEGIDNFTFEIIKECDKSIYTKEEKFYIDFYESNLIGYNMTK